ncbi:Beta-glucosidase-related glycosidase [Reinekea sp. MED297]|uniref:Beta-glucosidase-related glycosidase n=2 Tax=Reinekea TaxID=230494 RepID=A4BA30_9GAMM|nr:Beta-glucosidase-related glycosidase [Reinekea sp. MED297] [Reinekea blandensis MED297]
MTPTFAQQNLIPISRQAATEGIVLLENLEQTLPLTEGETLSVFGRCQIDTYRSGTGSGGAVNVPYAISILQGLRESEQVTVNETLAGVYEQWIGQNPFDDGGGGWAAEPWFQQEMPLTEALVAEAAEASHVALVVIGRTAGEDQDNADAPGSYRLTDTELAMMELVCARFDRVIVVLNVTNIIDMSWLSTLQGRDSIKAVLYSWAAGMEGGHALADVLAGLESPSGRLTDTIAWRLEDYPSSANFGRRDYNCYAEDIYVGYRYFETFKPDAVQYPFGAGLSYTRFEQALQRYSLQGEGASAQLKFEFSVTNLGDQAGKEVVQLYVEAPQGQLGKPARALAGFTKTETLAPGATTNVVITVPLSVLASYDDSGVTGYPNAYVLEAGDYRFYSGGDVRTAQRIDADWSQTELLVIEQLTEALAPIRPFARMKPGAQLDDGTYELTYEAAPQRKISLAERMRSNRPADLAITGDQGIRLIDVKNGDASLEDFVAQMSVEQLATIVRGEGMCSPKVTPGTAAAFGGVTDDLFALGIPIAAAADGPSGIRMDSGHKATQVPIGTLLACTWNAELNEKLFAGVGDELRANDIDTLLGPGINIHRHPLNGRNFEYFSEDPLMTGAMAAAQTRGLGQAGVFATLKHLVANDQETARVDVDSVVSQRALREVHLKPFELAVKEGNAKSIMTAYNPVNGHWTASSYDLNTTIVRGEWAFTGILMTDWWAKMNDPVLGGTEARNFTSFMVRSQNDLYMVVENDGAGRNAMDDDTLAALDAGTLSIGELQRSAMNICRFIMNAPVMERPLKAYEPVKTFAPDASLSKDDTISIAHPLELNLSNHATMVIDVPEDGVYRVHGKLRYDRNGQAQSTCSLHLNNEFSQSLSINGTDGKVVDVDGLEIRLGAGCYEMDIDFVKPGLVIETLSFIRA